jgi:MFS family permease
MMPGAEGFMAPALTEGHAVIANQKADLSAVADRTRRRIMRRIMPYLFLLFIIAYLDRVNVGYAALQMKGDLGFTDDILGFGAGIFFIGYFLFEIPGGILVEKWSARGWIARIMISWGDCCDPDGLCAHEEPVLSVALSPGSSRSRFLSGNHCLLQPLVSLRRSGQGRGHVYGGNSHRQHCRFASFRLTAPRALVGAHWLALAIYHRRSARDCVWHGYDLLSY